jgi:hypothetical protein
MISVSCNGRQLLLVDLCIEFLRRVAVASKITPAHVIREYRKETGPSRGPQGGVRWRAAMGERTDAHEAWTGFS